MVKSGHAVEMQTRYRYLVTAIGNGDRGVRLFFIISGFVLGLGFARQHLQCGKNVNLKKYFLRRVTRLEPPYIFNLVVCAVTAFVYYHQALSTMLPHLLASIFYLHNIAYRTPSLINGVTWSLEVEIQFYILAPLISLLFRISGVWLRRSVFLLMIALIGLLQMEFRVVATLGSLTIFYYLQYFLAGLLLTDLYLTEGPRFQNHWQWDVLSVCGWPLIFLIPANFIWYHELLPFLILPLYIAAFKGNLFRKFFSSTWIATIGGMCYSIYLWHFFVIGVFFKITRHLIIFHDFLLNLFAQVIGLGVPIAVVSVLMFVLIERPCMDPAWPRKLKALMIGRPNLVQERGETKDL